MISFYNVCYNSPDAETNIDYLCSRCLAAQLPFQALNNLEFLKVNSTEFIYSNLFTDILNINYDENNDDIDDTNNKNNCQYYDFDQAKAFLNNPTQTPSVTYLHVNIRSLKKNFESLEQLLKDLGTAPEIIGLTETKLNINKHSYFPNQLKEYQFIHTDSLRNSGGVGFFIKNSIQFTNHDDLKIINEDCENL